MSEEQFVSIVSQMLLKTGYTKTRDALLEEAKLHGFMITNKEIPLSKDLEIHETDEVRRAKRNVFYWNKLTTGLSEDEDRINNIELKLNTLRDRLDHLESIISLPNISI